MTKKPNIAVIAGGDSSEVVVSIQSVKNVFKSVNRDKFTPWQIHIIGDKWEVIQNEVPVANIDKSDFSFSLNGEKISFDFAYITIHGTPGEDGVLQAYFDLLKLPYSTCNVHSSSLTFNKWFCNNYLRNLGVTMANSLKLTRGDEINPEAIVDQLGLPIFIKPNAGGSSFGVSKVKDISEITKAIGKAWEESEEALVEQFIEGTEFTCGIARLNGEKIVFPVTEVLPKNEFFDFEAKYTPGITEEITPARLPDHLYKKCQEITSEIYDLCECEGIVRIDFILKGEAFYFLEVNTTPGMTATSFVPQQIEAMGSNLTDIITQIIEDKLS